MNANIQVFRTDYSNFTINIPLSDLNTVVDRLISLISTKRDDLGLFKLINVWNDEQDNYILWSINSTGTESITVSNLRHLQHSRESTIIDRLRQYAKINNIFYRVE